MTSTRANTPVLVAFERGGLYTYQCNHRVWNIIKKQQLLYENRKFCDVVLVSGTDGTRVPAHKIVLSASSDYFLDMFSDTEEGSCDEFTIERVGGPTLKQLVDFVYSNSIQLCRETVESILYAARRFQLNVVVAACSSYLLWELNLSNCLETALLAEEYNCYELNEKSLGLACSNFEKICIERQFLELNEDQLGKLLSRDELCVSSEEKVFLALVAWFQHKSDRKEAFQRLLQCIRFHLLDPNFILEHRESMVDCETWLESHKNPSPESTMPRRSNDKLALVSQRYGTQLLKLQTYNTATDEWYHIDIPTPKIWRDFYYDWLYANHKLIIAGGQDQEQGLPTKSVECFDFQTMQWADLPPMRVPRCQCNLVELNGQLYVIGGAAPPKWSLSKSGPSAEKYDFRTGKWLPIASLPSSVSSSFLVASLDGLLYVICLKTQTLASYDPTTNKWTRRADKPEKVTQFGMTAAGRYLYTFGGYSQRRRSARVDRYDPSTDTWETETFMKTALTDVKCIGFGNRLITCGGHNGKEHVNLVEEYNVDAKIWRDLAPVPFFAGYSCAPVVIKERLPSCT